MKTDQDRFRSYGTAFLVAISSLLLFYVLYMLRFLDDSRLVSWDDVFSVVPPLRTGIILCLSLAAAFMASRIELIERYPPATLFLVSFVVSGLFRQEPEMIVDASRYFTQAKHLELYGLGYFLREWGKGINAWTDLPLIPLMYGSIFRFFGEVRFFVQLINMLFFSTAVVLTYLTGRELWNRTIGFHGGLFLLCIPYLFTQVPLMMVDLPSMFFLLLSIYSFLLALRRGGFMVPTAGLIIFMTFFSKYSAWLMLTVIPVIYAVELHQNRKEGLDRYALRGLIVFFISFFLISIVAAFKHDELVKQVHFLISYQAPGLKRWGESLVSTYLFQMHPAIPVLAAVSLLAAFRKKDSAYIIVAWLVFLVLVLQVRRIRYIILIFPLLSLMAAYGLELIRDTMKARYIAYAAVAFSLTLGLSGFLPFLQHTSAANLRDAAAYLESLDVPVVEVFTPLPRDYVMDPAVSVPLLDLHTNKKILYRYEDSSYPLPEDIGISALRFTWAYKNPRYYQEGPKEYEKKAVVIISDSAEENLPPFILQKAADLSQKKVFDISDDVFRHKTVVTVYH
ncbi:MAG: glycosyltransferase family 39 protein [Nitrospirae bacterium]|nr:glycosyltransferase family 39 protein [Nitrospirota bacterium]